jgi:hypothetical protein
VANESWAKGQKNQPMKSRCGCSVLPLGLVFLVHLLPLLSLDLAKSPSSQAGARLSFAG